MRGPLCERRAAGGSGDAHARPVDADCRRADRSDGRLHSLDDLGFSEVEAGWLGSVEMMSAAGVALLAAPFMSRLSVVRVALTGVLLASLAQFGSAFLDSFWPLVGARLIAGMGAGLAVAAAAATAAAAADPDRLYGYVFGGFMVLMSFMTPVLAAVIDAAGIAGGYALLGSVVLLALPFLRWLDHAARSPVNAESQKSLPRAELLLLMTLMMLFGIGPGPTWAFMERIGVSIGIEASRVGIFFSIGILFGLLGSLAAGRVGARGGKTRPLVLGLLILAASCLGLGFASHEGVYLALIVLFWFTYLFVEVLLFAAVAAFDPTGRVGPAAVGAFMIVLGLGPALGGFLITVGSYATTGWFAVGVCGVAVLLIAVAGRSLNRPGASPSEEMTARLS